MNLEAAKILIIIPAFNESGNITRTIADIKKQNLPVDILVIDDGSTDTTAQEACQAGVQVISLPFNVGIGGAVQTGFQYALHYGYDMAVQFDGDGQHDASFLRKVIAPILEDQADMVVGSRFIESDGGFKSSLTRRIGIHFFVRLINTMTGLNITDPTSGFRVHNRKIIAAFAHDYPQDFPEPEAIVAAKRLGARISETAVLMRQRQGGQSSIRQFKSLYYMVKVTFAICLHLIRRQPFDETQG
ncbi:MAG: glycosyltransferase family 2 protein [Candidatus Omnitrophica bacterium]|nr:glycosyltransferase family 2 protein [Candidatus Omnitrophota bacterium]